MGENPFCTIEKPRYRIDQNVRTIKDPIIQCISIGGYYYVPMLACILHAPNIQAMNIFHNACCLSSARVCVCDCFVPCHRIRAQFNFRCHFHLKWLPHTLSLSLSVSLSVLLYLCATESILLSAFASVQPIIRYSLHNNIILRIVWIFFSSSALFIFRSDDWN